MKKSINFLKGLTLVLLTVFMVSCSDDDNGSTPAPQPNTIADFVKASTDHTSLVAALDRADLVGTLSGTDKFTVFAPNNAAFTAFLNDKGFDNLDAVPVETLKQILLNHVVSGAVKYTDLSTGYVNTLSTATPNSKNMSMYVDTSSGVKLNGSVDVTGADKIVDNGIVHLVEKVIDLPTVVTFATADANFSTLVTALTTATPNTDFAGILSRTEGGNNDNIDPPFTVFAPTNDAFAALLTELNAKGLGDIATATLESALLNHVVGGKNVVAGDLKDDTKVTTLGGDITANVTGGATLTDSNDRVSKITATDVQASNGVTHVIDKVVLPLLDKK